MRQIRLLDLGNVPYVRSQTVYHAAAYLADEVGVDSIILVSPERPYVCLGFHQDLEKEVELDFCRERGLPIVRREVGGGAVYLDQNQVFIQWVFRQGQLPDNLTARFELYARPLVETYQALGINASFRPVNDIHVEGKKIGGTGAAQLGAADVVVGSLMFDFDKETMSRVLKVSSEKMRDKVFESLTQYMTTMVEQLGAMPDRRQVLAQYLKLCAGALQSEIVPGLWTTAEETKAKELDTLFTSQEWLLQQGGLRTGPGVKISEDVRVVDGAFKAPGGLIRVTARLRNQVIDDISLTGDFTLLPASAGLALEEALMGVVAEAGPLLAAIGSVYRQLAIESPGVTAQDFAQAVLNAAAQSSR